MNNLTAVKNYGGKANHADWIVSHLPQTECYIEPWFGMGSVLLARPPCPVEIVCDLNGDIVNWWRVIRERPDDLARMVTFTPRSRSELEYAWELLDGDCDDPLKRAWALQINLLQGMNATTGCKPRWSMCIKPSVGSVYRCWPREKYTELAIRMCNVQVENRSAESLLERVADIPYALVYCDPPYYSAKRQYSHNDVDVDALTDLFQRQKGSVAISGYDGEWDHLGWRRVEKDVTTMASEQRTQRTEMLWMNFGERNGDLFA